MRTKYDKLYISWRSIKDLAYDDAAYLSLMDNFKKLGYLEDYDNSYYEYRSEHRGQNWSGGYHGMGPKEEWIRKRFDFGLETFYGYGKRPFLPLIWSIGTVIFFGVVWRISKQKRHKDSSLTIFEKYNPAVVSVSKKRPHSLDWKNELNALGEAMIFSVVVFLSGTRLFIDPPEIPTMQKWSRSTTKAAFIAERILGDFSLSCSSLPLAQQWYDNDSIRS
jgi:hypothetical protein